MNQYLRAIGFSKIKNNEQLRPILDHLLIDPEAQNVVCDPSGTRGCLSQSFGENIGIRSFVEYSGDAPLREEYYFPYADTEIISTTEHCDVERKGDAQAYLGMCDEKCLSISLIFFISNAMDYLARTEDGEPSAKASNQIKSVSITGLSTEGKILLPIKATVREREFANVQAGKQAGLMEAARDGDAEAIEKLAMDDMKLTQEVASRLEHEDIYSLIDTYFMPSGMESDRYSLIGRIIFVQTVENTLTGEEMWRMQLNSNGLGLSVIINKKDLLGVPEPGLRFKGEVWLQGRLRFE